MFKHDYNQLYTSTVDRSRVRTYGSSEGHSDVRTKHIYGGREGQSVSAETIPYTAVLLPCTANLLPYTAVLLPYMAVLLPYTAVLLPCSAVNIAVHIKK